MNKNYKIEDYIGIIFFIGAIILLLSMIFNPLNRFFIHIDEYFTIGLINLPIINGIQLTAVDAHPPLYYLILKVVTKILNILHIHGKGIYLLKLVSVIPYFILLLVSGTKIKKEYGWLTAGIFIFAIGIMGNFYINYITLRMYSWSLLFLVLAFISLKGVIENNDTKSWILLTIFTILGAYTHYYLVMSSFVLYIILLFYILTKTEDNKINLIPIFSNIKSGEFKKWVLSVISIIIAYIPWLAIAMKKATSVTNGKSTWISPITVDRFFNLLTNLFTPSKIMVIKIIAIITLIVIFYLAISKYKEDRKNVENSYILMGIGVLLGTLLISTLISIFLKPILVERYLLPVAGVLWFVFAILIGKIENKKKLAILLTLILVLAIGSSLTNIDNLHNLYKKGMNDKQALEEMNNNNSIIIYSSVPSTLLFENQLYKSKRYTPSKVFGKVNLKLKSKTFKSKDLKKIIKKNKGKKIYLIKNYHNKKKVFKNTTEHKICTMGQDKYIIYKIYYNN